MSLSNGKVSSDVCTLHVYPITIFIKTPVSDLIMLFFIYFFFLRGKGAEMYDLCRRYYYLSFNYSEWKDWRWQFISSHGSEVSILSNNWTWTAKDRKQKGPFCRSYRIGSTADLVSKKIYLMNTFRSLQSWSYYGKITFARHKRDTIESTLIVNSVFKLLALFQLFSSAFFQR